MFPLGGFCRLLYALEKSSAGDSRAEWPACNGPMAYPPPSLELPESRRILAEANIMRNDQSQRRETNRIYQTVQMICTALSRCTNWQFFFFWTPEEMPICSEFEGSKVRNASAKRRGIPICGDAFRRTVRRGRVVEIKIVIGRSVINEGSLPSGKRGAKRFARRTLCSGSATGSRQGCLSRACVLKNLTVNV